MKTPMSRDEARWDAVARFYDEALTPWRHAKHSGRVEPPPAWRKGQ